MRNNLPEKGRDIRDEGRIQRISTSLHQLLEQQPDNRLATLLAAGDQYYFLFDVSRGDFEWISPEIAHILGYRPDDLTLSLLLDKIHPDDVSWFSSFEKASLNFFTGLPPDKRLKYKSRYDYRIMKQDGSFVRILQQTIPFSHCEDGQLLYILGTHTDISYLKNSNTMTLSFIGLEGEPSYIRVDQNNNDLLKENTRFSKRELEVMRFLAGGFSSKQAGDKLHLSAETINTYRRKLLKKMRVNNVAELVRAASEQGLI